MADLIRRKLLTGALVGGAALGVAGRAMAQAQTPAGGTEPAIAAAQDPGQATPDLATLQPDACAVPQSPAPNPPKMRARFSSRLRRKQI